jgi:pimeloyl-ACP methyl ester carboxylesterase
MLLAHQRKGSGEPLLLLHGLGSHWQMWCPILDSLATTQEVIAVDLPGFGGSAPLEPQIEPTVQALARIVAAFLDECGWRNAHMAGNSLGGWIALELAKLGRAKSVVAISPAGFWTPGELRFARASLRLSRALARLVGPIAPTLLSSSIGRTVLLWQMYTRPWRIPAGDAVLALRNFAGAPGFGRTLEAISRPEGFSGGESIRCPVTVAWGTRDRLLPPRQLTQVRARIPRACIALLDGCGHVPTWDDPDQTASTLQSR